MTNGLDHKQEALLASLVAGKLPRNLAWSDVVELIGRLGQVLPRSGNEVEFVIGSHKAFFNRPHTHSLEVEEVSRLRKFLHEAELGPATTQAAPAGRAVVVIDHHAARIYQNPGGGALQRTETDRPHDPDGFHRHLIHRKEAHYLGERVPEEDSFYEQIAQTLVPAKEIVLIGHGTGKSSALDFLVEYLKSHHPTIVPQIVSTQVADLSALTEPQMEALAAKHF